VFLLVIGESFGQHLIWLTLNLWKQGVAIVDAPLVKLNRSQFKWWLPSQTASVN